MNRPNLGKALNPRVKSLPLDNTGISRNALSERVWEAKVLKQHLYLTEMGEVRSIFKYFKNLS